MRPVFIDHSMRGVLKAASPMMTGASLAPSPCCRQRRHSAVFCCSRSILGMGSVLLTALLGEFAVEHVERTSVRDLGHLAKRALALAGSMRFEFLYDRRRRIFSIGYRLADANGPGRLDTSFYDLLASEARLASFVAIVKGDVPQHHWFHLGRLVTNVDGRATLMSWGGTMFEYLMPQLLLRSYPGTLLDQSCRASVRRQIEYGKEQSVPWGISEAAFAFTDRFDTYQYKAFGVPGLGFKRSSVDSGQGLADMARWAGQGC